ncbi:MAG: hypothetical protein IPL79_00550 [Myxococcales bacterium]|nr:hypothetical protein [Myxococcales bacterium]
MRFFASHYLLPFALGLAIFAALAGERLTRGSAAPQFVYQADAWLHGSLEIAPPLQDQDWAKLTQVTLASGETRWGRRLTTQPDMFRATTGETMPIAEIAQWGREAIYMSFPPFPTLLMLPVAATSGRDGNDVATTVVLAAMIAPLCLLFLRRLRREIHGDAVPAKAHADDVWLTLALVLGSVLLYASVGGKVWYTAHVTGVLLCLLYATASLGARAPFFAGLAFGAAVLTRTPMVFMMPLFLLEVWRVAGSGRRRAWLLVQFVLPAVAFAAAAMWHNHARFGSFTEFGHSYLDVRQQLQIEQHGLFAYEYLSRNLSVALTLLPHWLGQAPWIAVSGHGMALWVTSPFLLWLLAGGAHATSAPTDQTMIFPSARDAVVIPISRALRRSLAISAAAVALPALFYQNSGWVQFGYRFSLDYMVLLLGILALGGVARSRWFRAAVVLAIAINIFGAITFDRYPQFYKTNAYPVIIAN